MIPPVDTAPEQVRASEPAGSSAALAPAAGSVRVRRSGVLAGAIIFAVLALATAGVVSGVNRSAQGPRGPGPVLSIRPGRTVTAQPSVPVIATPYVEEPGAPVTAQPVGPAGAPLTRAARLPATVVRTPPGPAPAPVSAVQVAAAPERAAPLRASASEDLAPGQAADRCAGARTAVQAVLCNRPDLAARDRRVRDAYQRMLRDSDDPEGVAADQARYLDARERAARRGDEDALQDLYAQRLSELEPR